MKAAFSHEGPARRLVHRLKYDGAVRAADVLVEPLVPLLAGLTLLVPVPRVAWRRWRYGVDPALVIADALSRRCGIPVSRTLRPQWWAAPHAGRSRAERRRPTFGLVLGTDLRIDPRWSRVALVDDVVTTGTTLLAAQAALASHTVRMALCATSANTVLKSVPESTDLFQ